MDYYYYIDKDSLRTNILYALYEDKYVYDMNSIYYKKRRTDKIPTIPSISFENLSPKIVDITEENNYKYYDFDEINLDNIYYKYNNGYIPKDETEQ